MGESSRLMVGSFHVGVRIENAGLDFDVWN